jgi:peptidyl-prolyl cis-trans isomerase D
MLQSIRDKITGWVAIVFLGAIGIVFIFWGIDVGSVGNTGFAAKVDGENIPIEKVQRAWQERERRLQEMLRGPVPETMAKMQQQQVIDEQIQIELLSQRARDLGYRVGDDLLRETIDSFEGLKVDGKFSNEQYALALASQGRSKAEFERELREGMLIDHLQRGIAASAFVTPSELVRRTALENEQREIDYAVIPFADYLLAAAPTDAEIQAWYDSHASDYMTQETVDLEYLEVKLADVSAEVEVNDEALLAYYDQVKERLTTPERRRARHILLSVNEPKDDEAAKKTADEVFAKVNAGGDFAALAKQYSQDTVSAAKGGDLDWAARGMFVGPFEDALFAMNKGEVRGPIKTQFGYHIIRLDDIEGGTVKSFADARAELEADYRNEKAQALFYERTQKLADDAFASLTNLASVGEALKLPLQKVAGFSRQGGGAFGSDPKIIEAAFRLEAIEKGENSALIALADDHAVVLRVAAHQPAKQLPLTAVRTQIEMKLKQQAASAAAAKRGAELLALLEEGAAWASTMAQAKLATIGKRSINRNDSTVPQPVRQAAFDVPKSAVTDKPAIRGVTMDDGSYAVFALTKIQPGVFEAGTPESAAKLREAGQTQGGVEVGAYVAEAQRNAKIVRNSKVFE